MAENLWPTDEHALWYLTRADSIPHRDEGEAELLDLLPTTVERVLDLGCGDGRLLALVRAAHPGAGGIAVDFSPVMLAAATARFHDVDGVDVLAHDLDQALPDLGGPFDAVVSSFAIHHVDDGRKQALYQEIFGLLRPGGAFLNLEHVASPTERLHNRFLVAVGADPDNDDPSNLLAPVEDQLRWLRAIGFDDVDCHWKWREMALLAGVRP